MLVGGPNSVRQIGHVAIGRIQVHDQRPAAVVLVHFAPGVKRPVAAFAVGVDGVDSRRCGGVAGQDMGATGLNVGDAQPGNTAAVSRAGGLVSYRRVEASRFGYAAIIGARICVVAVQGIEAWLAGAIGAAIIEGAGIGIIAPGIIGDKEAAQRVVTAIVGAGIVVGAGDGHAPATDSQVAEFVGGAGIGVVARQIVEFVEASLLAVATVGCAGILVVTIQIGPRCTLAHAALVTIGAGIGIVAGCGIGRESTAGFRLTAVICAGVVVLARKGGAGQAPAVLTHVTDSAGIAVVTVFGIGSEGATHIGLAAIVGAGIGIIAGERTAADALAEVAVVPRGAYVLVIARGVIEHVQAA